MSVTMMPTAIPNKPRVPESTNNGNRSNRNGKLMLYLGIENDAMPVLATMMTIGAEINPARTAASPITIAPTMLTAEPIARGKRKPASRNPSNMISIINVSKKVGNGMPSLAAEMLIINATGIICGWNVVSAT